MARNQIRGMIQEMSDEERGGGGPKEDEKVYPNSWFFFTGSLILNPGSYSLVPNCDYVPCFPILICDLDICREEGRGENSGRRSNCRSA